MYRNGKWTDEIKAYLYTRRREPSSAIIDDLNEKFGTSFSIHALISARTTYRLCEYRNSPRPTHARPIGSEQIKKGYIRVKVAQPDVWKFKHVFIWEKAHNDTVNRYETVVFLDGNNRNFSIDNLYKLTRREILRMNSKGLFSHDPEETLLHIALIKQRLVFIDKAKKLGMCSQGNTLRFERAEYYQRIKNTEAHKKYAKEYAKKYRESHPDFVKRQREAHRKYMKNYYQEHKHGVRA